MGAEIRASPSDRTQHPRRQLQAGAGGLSNSEQQGRDEAEGRGSIQCLSSRDTGRCPPRKVTSDTRSRGPLAPSPRLGFRDSVGFLGRGVMEETRSLF